MLEIIDSAGDVIAVKISDVVTGADLHAVMDRLDSAMARPGKVHLFVETHSIDGLQLAGLSEYMARALPLFGELARFGRVAVVADQAWIRAGSRLESAILPSITYRVFTPDQREAALAWVEGITAEESASADPEEVVA